MFRKTVVVLVCLCSVSFAQVVADPYVLGYWDFNEGVGTTANNKYSLQGNGTIHGAEWVDGIDGKALRFNGTSDYVDCGRPDALNYTAPSIIIMAWIYLEQPFPVGAYQSIVQNGDSYRMMLVDNAGNPDDGGVTLHGLGPNKNAGFCQHNAEASTFFETHRWYFIAVTYNGYNGMSRVIIDGVPVLTNAAGLLNYPDGLAASTYSFRIGNQGAPPWGESNWFRGRIDQVEVYGGFVGPVHFPFINERYTSTMTDVVKASRPVKRKVVKTSNDNFDIMGRKIKGNQNTKIFVNSGYIHMNP